MNRHQVETTTGATRNVPLPVRQSKHKASYLVSTTQAAESCARPVSTSYYPEAKKTTLKVLNRFLRP